MDPQRHLKIAALVTLFPLVAASAGASDAGESGMMTLEAARNAVAETVVSVAEIRGLDFKQEVPVAVIDDAAAREHALSRFELFYTEERLDAIEEAYVLLGLLPEGTDILEAYLDVLEEQAGGFYDPRTKSFYVLADMPAGLAEMIVAHELTHALEDQHFDLDGRALAVNDNEDAVFARGAIHEGSAMLVMNRYMLDAMLSGNLNAEGLSELAESEAGRAEKLGEMPPVLSRPLFGSYMLGMSFLLRGNMIAMADEFPREDVDRAFGDSPASSEQLLHPEKYWDPERRDDPETVTINVEKVLGEGWRRAGEGILGELILGLMVGVPTPSPANAQLLADGKHWTNDAAAGWGGDLWQLWRGGGQTVLVLKTVWDTDEDAEEFAAALPDRDGTAWKLKGNRVAFVAGDTGDSTNAFLKALLKK